MNSSKGQPKRVRQGRSGRPFARVRAQVFAEETDCAWCGRYVDQSLPPTSKWGRTADHIVPLSMGGHPTKRSNLRLMHRRCNTLRHKQMTQPARRQYTTVRTEDI